MIVKFDHITYVASKKDFDKSKIPLEYVKFQEKHLENSKGKQTFMYNKCLDADLFYIEDKMPVELVLYDKIVEKTDILVKDNTIYAYCKSASFPEIDSFLKVIGFKVLEQKENERIYKISGVFDQRETFLNIKEKQDIGQPLLDGGGWNCPCFLIDSVEKLFHKLSDEKCICTSVEHLIVNNRKLEIGFLKNDNMGLILEFIAPIRKV